MTPLNERHPADIRWTVTTYNGCEIKTAPQGLTHEEAMDLSNWPNSFKSEVIKAEDGIKDGDLILCPTLHGWTIARIEAHDDGFIGMSHDKSHMYLLDFGEDDRECWVCGGAANIGSIKKLELTHGS